MANKLIDKILNPEQALWLETVYSKSVNSDAVNIESIKLELKDKLPENFAPSLLPSAFLENNKITLLGRLLVNTEDEYVKDANKVLTAIREILKVNSKTRKINTGTVSKITGLDSDRIKIIFIELASLDVFSNLKISKIEAFQSSFAIYTSLMIMNALWGWDSIQIDEKNYNEFLKYESLEQILESYVLDKSLTIITDITADTKIQNNLRKVFVVHGRNLKLYNEVCSFLRSINLDPMEWSEARKLTGKTNPYVGEIIDAGFNNAQAVLVLFTPDDTAKLIDSFIKEDDGVHEKELTPQPRQNVIFEAGMAMAKFPERTVLVQVGKIRPMSDISGLHIIQLNNSTETRQELAERLKDAHCDVKTEGKTSWHKEGNFELTDIEKQPQIEDAESKSGKNIIDNPEKRNHKIERLKELIKEYEKTYPPGFHKIAYDSEDRARNFEASVERFLKNYFNDSYVERYSKDRLIALEDFLNELLS